MTTETDKTQKHQARMQRIKEKVDARIDSAQEERGLLIVITGNGKGKSTSGFGTLARAVGHGYKAAALQFIKGDWACGERNLLENNGVEFHVMATGFTWDTQDKSKDELTYMLSYKYLDLDEVIEAIVNRPAMQHVIITGRACHRSIIELADTVSEVQPLKHAFDNGIKAQKGIDW
jgi:cob(I)alamin adenosyltransferase